MSDAPQDTQDTTNRSKGDFILDVIQRAAIAGGTQAGYISLEIYPEALPLAQKIATVIYKTIINTFIEELDKVEMVDDEPEDGEPESV